MKRRACIVVLGDIGRSPRMQYHALSLLKEGYDVDIIGYGGSSPQSNLLFSPKVSLHFMPQPPTCISSNSVITKIHAIQCSPFV